MESGSRNQSLSLNQEILDSRYEFGDRGSGAQEQDNLKKLPGKGGKREGKALE